MGAALSVRDLSVFYEKKAAISHVSYDFEPNKITAVIGPSGCGKTTLLHSLNGLVEEVADAKRVGEVLLGGKSVDKIPVEELRRRVGLVFQTPKPFPFSVFKNLTYAPKYYGIHDKKKLEELVVDKLKMVGLYDEIKDDLHKSALKFSGGQQQRICIARALTAEPEVLLLDEPCSALDIKSSAVIEDALLNLKDQYTIVIVTHNIQQARRIADRAVFLYNGELKEAGEAEQIFNEPREAETQEFLKGIYG